MEPLLPVPIEHIVEGHFGLTILWEELPDTPTARILGALSPTERTIRLNERHQGLFEQFIGPERFTLAHELAHWLYDVGDPNQGTLFEVGEAGPPTVLCQTKAGTALVEGASLREVNANKLAACLLLPADLVYTAVRAKPLLVSQPGRLAAEWGVSKTTLRIRLEDLGVGNVQESVALGHNTTLW